MISGSPYKLQLQASLDRINAKTAPVQGTTRGRGGRGQSRRGRGRGRGRNNGIELPTSVPDDMCFAVPSTSGVVVPSSSGRRAVKRSLNFRNRKDSSSAVTQSDCSEDEDGGIRELAEADIDAICLFCSEKYSDDRPNEQWIQCIICENWAHSACTDCEKPSYICDWCREE